MFDLKRRERKSIPTRVGRLLEGTDMPTDSSQSENSVERSLAKTKSYEYNDGQKETWKEDRSIELDCVSVQFCCCDTAAEKHADRPCLMQHVHEPTMLTHRRRTRGEPGHFIAARQRRTKMVLFSEYRALDQTLCLIRTSRKSTTHCS